LLQAAVYKESVEDARRGTASKLIKSNTRSISRQVEVEIRYIAFIHAMYRLTAYRRRCTRRGGREGGSRERNGGRVWRYRARRTREEMWREGKQGACLESTVRKAKSATRSRVRATAAHISKRHPRR
jgi:hypothetical protein